MFKDDVDNVIKNNDLLKSNDYIIKSKINRRTLREMHIPDYVSVEQAKQDFDECDYRLVKTGVPFNTEKQRHTKLVSRYALYNKIIKGR